MPFYAVKAHALTPQLLARDLNLGRDVWIKYDPEFEGYCLFASSECNDPIGEADDLHQSRNLAAGWFNELQGY